MPNELKYPGFRVVQHIVLAAAMHAAPLRANAQQPLELRDVLSLRAFADRVPLDLAADGHYVAFTLIDRIRADSLARGVRSRYFAATGSPVDMLGADVVVTNTRTGVTVNLTRAAISVLQPAP